MNCYYAIFSLTETAAILIFHYFIYLLLPG
jgi:hypothetical protein